MTEPPVTFGDWPVAKGTKIVWRRALVKNDDMDEDLDPNWEADTPKLITLVPDIKGLLVYTPEETVNNGEPIAVQIEEVNCRIDERGYLTSLTGGDVRVIATDDERLSATGWTWYVKEHPEIRFAAPSGTVVDLSDFVIAPDVDETKYWVEKIPELVDLIGDLNGIVDIQLVDGELVITMTDASVHTFPLPVASWNNLQDKPATFPVEFPFIEDDPDEELVLARDYTGSATNPSVYLKASGFRIEDHYSLGDVVRTTYGTTGAETTIWHDLPTPEDPYNAELKTTKYLGTGISVDDFVMAFPQGAGLTETLATREWVENQANLIGTDIVGKGRPDLPGTTDYSATFLNDLPIGTKFRSTNKPQGAAEWVKSTDTVWLVTQGDTRWLRDTMWSPQPPGQGPIIRRVNNQLYVTIPQESNPESWNASFMGASLPDTLTPEPFVMDTFSSYESWPQATGQLRIYNWSQMYFTMNANSRCGGSGIYPISRSYEDRWPSESDLARFVFA